MAYTSQAIVSIPAASGSNQTNISLVITGTDTKLKTVANGGQIQNTVTRVGQTVPADLIVTSDSAGTLLYNWGYDFYDPVNGIIVIWLLMPTHSSAGATTVYITIGNTAVTTYQGGAQGAEFDTNTKAVWHLPDGVTLNAKDFTTNSNDGTASGVTATTGKINGAGNFVQASSQDINCGTGSSLNITGDITVSAWINLAGTGGTYKVIAARFNGTAGAYYFYIVNQDLRWYDGTEKSSGSTIAASTWTHVAFVRNGTGGTFYINGASFATTSGLFGPTSYSATAKLGSVGSQYFDGKLDEITISSIVRSTDWIATEYANQNSIPVAGTFSSLSTAYTKSLSETYTLAEVFFKRTSRSVSETYTLAETLKRAISISPSEVFNLAESFIKVSPMGRVNLNDAIQVLDFFRISLLRDPSLSYYRQYMLDLSGIAAGSTSPTIILSGPLDPSTDFYRRYLGRI